MRWLVRFGYDGEGFSGWARQPGLRTVEGEIRAGLVRQGVARSVALAHLEVASRTDRGVSARANALAVFSERPGEALLRGLNGTAPDIFCTAATPIPEEFRLRAALRRVYRYYEPAPPSAVARWQRLSRLFRGAVDVRSFGRGLPGDRPVIRTVESVEVHEAPGGLVVELRAPSFVWGMVRKIVGALRECDRGRLPESRLRAAIEGRERLTLPLAEAERLVLWDVEYPVAWTVRWSGPNRHQSARDVQVQDGLWARAEVLQALRVER
jgi:tRNA pseudouridine38-40 synthase